jgi:plexin A
MECPSPPINNKFLSALRVQRSVNKTPRSLQKFRETALPFRIGFVMDNVEAVRDLEKHFQSLRSQLLYVEDPKFFQFPNNIKLYKGDTLVIEVSYFITIGYILKIIDKNILFAG